MNRRTAPLLAVLALSVTACGGDSANLTAGGESRFDSCRNDYTVAPIGSIGESPTG